MESPGKSERHFIVRWEKEHRWLEGSQASPVRPSDKSRVEVKMKQWLERGVQSTKLLLALASTVAFGFGPHRDP
jgi:hypothetical protein